MDLVAFDYSSLSWWKLKKTMTSSLNLCVLDSDTHFHRHFDKNKMNNKINTCMDGCIIHNKNYIMHLDSRQGEYLFNADFIKY